MERKLRWTAALRMGLPALFLVLFAAAPKAQNLTDDLNSASQGTVTGGGFSGGGWQTQQWSDMIEYDLGAALTEGSFEIEVLNFDPRVQNSSARHHILSMYTDRVGDHNHDDYNSGAPDKSVWNIHAGSYYSGGLKFLSIAGNKIQSYAQSLRFSLNQTYRFKVTWTAGVVEFYIDGSLIARNVHEASFSLRYLFIGRDWTRSVDITTNYPVNEYPALQGPIYANLVVNENAVANSPQATEPPAPEPPSAEPPAAEPPAIISSTSASRHTQFVGLAQSFIARVPNPQNYGAMDWRMVNALYGILRAYQYNGDTAYLNYIRRWADHHVDQNGSFDTAIIDVFPGGLLLELYQITGENRYLQAGLKTRDYLNNSFSRLGNGVFVHTQGDQVWVDTLFGVIRFLIPLARVLNDNHYLDEAAEQIVLHAQILQDDATGLFYHGWDEDGSADWADSQTHLSPEFWGRGNGWVIASIADLMAVLPSAHPDRNPLLAILDKLSQGLAATQDGSGLWYTVLDKPGDSGNYLESSGTSLFVYGLQKAIDSGSISSSYQTQVDRGNSGLDSRAYSISGGEHSVTKVSAGTNAGSTQYYYGRSVGTGFQYHYGHGVFLEAKSLGLGSPPPVDPTATITTSAFGAGHVALDPPGGSYGSGDVVTVRAIADAGWSFTGWSGNLSGNSNPAAVIASGNLHITAHFTQTSTGQDPIPAGDMVITINCDDEYDLWVNGTYLGSNIQWDVAQTYTAPVQGGENIIAVQGRNTGGPTGLVAQVSVNGTIVLQTGGAWRWHDTEQPGWTSPGFDDGAWTGITDLGAYGVSPWGKNIAGFPSGSQARWIWGSGDSGFFRVSFTGSGEPPPAPSQPDPPPEPTPEPPPGNPPPVTTGDMHILINTDDSYELWVNGSLLGSDGQWDVAHEYTAPLLAGENIIAVKGNNRGNVAGLIAEITVDGSPVYQTDSGWRWSASQQAGWTETGFNDGNWSPVNNLGSYGATPWGTAIANFSPSGTPYWIWGTGQEIYFRGRFISEQGSTPTQPDTLAVDPAPTPQDSVSVSPGDSTTTTPADSISTPPTDSSSTVPSDSVSVPPSDSTTTTPADSSTTAPPDSSVTPPPPTDVGASDSMQIIINADDIYTLWVNGQYVGENVQWDQAQQYTVAALAGNNLVAVMARNRGSGARGLIVEVKIGGATVFRSDESWRYSEVAETGWQLPEFGDLNWAAVNSLGPYGISPWGKTIAGFPIDSQAHWLWGSGQQVYFRGHFQNPGSDIQALRSHDPAVTDNRTPEGFSLLQSYPNPFNPSVTIRFSLENSEWVRLAIFDVHGREVALLIDDLRSEGLHNQIWRAEDALGRLMPSGIYFYQIRLAGRAYTGKMTLMR